MTRYPAVSTSLYRPPAPAAAPAHARTSKGGIAFWLLLALLVFDILNFGALYTRLFGAAVPINPITYMLLGLPIFLLGSRPKTKSIYFPIAWTFWVIYTLGGFLGPYQITGVYFYGTLQKIFKIWICLIGTPMLAMRALNERTLPKYIRVCCVLITIGAILAIVQLFFPYEFGDATQGGGRGAGVWINPNLCATMCAAGVFFSMIAPFRFGLLNILIRAIMCAGIFATLSRGGILACFFGLVVYGFMTMRLATMMKAFVVVILLAVVGIISLDPLTRSNVPGLAERARGVQQILKGGSGITKETKEGRLFLWQGGIRACMQHWLRGRGHGSMHYVIKTKYLEGFGRWHQVGPHNFYIFVWGNSGLFALLALGAYWLNMWRVAHQCKPRQHRAILMAIVAMLMLLAMADHSMFDNQFVGVIMAIFVLVGHYGHKSHFKKRRRQASVPQAVGYA